MPLHHSPWPPTRCLRCKCYPVYSTSFSVRSSTRTARPLHLSCINYMLCATFLEVEVCKFRWSMGVFSLLRKIHSWKPGMTKVKSIFHGILTDWSILTMPFPLSKKGSSGPVTQWRQLVSCDWSRHSHGSLIHGKFDLKINRSMKI